MAGARQCCNHVIACLYKMEYESTPGYIDPSCTSTVCAWNEDTKKEVEPKRISDIVVRKRVRSKYQNIDDQGAEAIAGISPKIRTTTPKD